MLSFRYTEFEDVTTELNPMEDAVDWLAGFESVSRLTKTLIKTRGISQDEAKSRAKRGTSFAKSAMDFIEDAKNARPHTALLPVYYAYLNLCKLMIACSDESHEVESGITHGVSYRVGQKNSQSLFTEAIWIRRNGVFPVLYRVLTGESIRFPKKKNFRSIRLGEVYARTSGLTAEYSMATGQKVSSLCYADAVSHYNIVQGETAGRCKITSVYGHPIPTGTKLSAFPNWSPQSTEPELWQSESRKVHTASDFDLSEVIRRQFFYMPVIGRSTPLTLFALSKGNLKFTEELPIFLVLYHLSSIVRYKPRFLNVIKNTDAWPLVLAARRHLLFKGILLTLSYILQKNVCIGIVK